MKKFIILGLAASTSFVLGFILGVLVLAMGASTSPWPSAANACVGHGGTTASAEVSKTTVMVHCHDGSDFLIKEQ